LAEGDEIAPGRTVLKALGGGTRYEVLLVWDDERFAIMVAKVLRPAAAGDEHAVRELAREAEALAALSHPAILRGFDAALDGAHPHLLVEHLEGPTLRRLLKAEGRRALQQLIPLGLHVAAGIAYMETAGWVHLDLKPDNLIMGVPPRIIDLDQGCHGDELRLGDEDRQDRRLDQGRHGDQLGVGDQDRQDRRVDEAADRDRVRLGDAHRQDRRLDPRAVADAVPGGPGRDPPRADLRSQPRRARIGTSAARADSR
jgi:serine/threonine protein kinase